MGNTFGNMPNNGMNLYFHPEITPDPTEDPLSDPNIGFPEGRKIRETSATQAEFESAKLPLRDRDYCAHHLLKFRACRKDAWPFTVKCEHEKHVYLHCQHDDYIHRMKEWERERRLMVREVKAQG